MASVGGIMIAIAGITFFFYMTGYKGLIAIAVLLVILMALIYFKQNMLLYMPVVPGLPKSSSQNSIGMRHPNEHNLESVDLTLNTSDGVIIRGWHIKANRSERIIIYFHQNAGNIGTRLYYVREMSMRTHSDVILVAYRGYSDSQSVPSEQGLMRDSYAVMQYASSYSKEHSKMPIYVLGRSLGGAVTINLAVQELYQNEIKALVLQNTFTSIGDMVDVLFPFLGLFKFLQTNFWSSIDKIGDIKIPILFIKSMQDELVPPEHMNRLMRAAKSMKKQYLIKRGTHNSSWDTEPEKYFKTLQQFFDELEN